MEFPNQAKKWDRPLFQLRAHEEMPFEDILATILNIDKAKPRDPVSTKSEQIFDQNFLYELDKACQKVSNYII